MSNVKICKASSSPSPPPAPSILALVVREKLSKEVSLPAEKSGGAGGCPGELGDTLLFSERLGKRKPKGEGQVLDSLWNYYDY